MTEVPIDRSELLVGIGSFVYVWMVLLGHLEVRLLDVLSLGVARYPQYLYDSGFTVP